MLETNYAWNGVQTTYILTFPLEKVMVIQGCREGKRVVGSGGHQTVKAGFEELSAVNESETVPGEQYETFHVVGDNWDTTHDLCPHVSVAVDVILFVGAFAENSDEEVTIVASQVMKDDRGTCCLGSIFSSKLHALWAAPRNLPVCKKAIHVYLA